MTNIWLVQWLGGMLVGWCLLTSVAVAMATVTDEKRVTVIAEDQILTQRL